MVLLRKTPTSVERTATARHGKYRLDELDPVRMAKHLIMFDPSEQNIVEIVAQARLSIPGITETEEVLKVARHNPDCIMALAHRSKFDPKAPEAEGLVAILPLNALGLRLLALGTFDTKHPDLRLVARPNERPAGIYMWCFYGPGSLAAGTALFIERMSAPQYAGIDLYSRSVTDAGRNFHEVLGFCEGAQIGATWAPHLWHFPRAQKPPLYDSYKPGAAHNEVGITVARTFDDIMRVAAVRNSVYIGEQECPYDEEYDGNDLSATHLLAYIGDEPVGCLRLRFFAGFAKFERMAIRKEFRKSRAAIQLARAGFKFCQKKGYRRVYGHIQERLVSFWSRFGFRVMENSQRFVFSDFEYVEIVADIEPDPDAIAIGADPYILIRPEGRWHVPGVLETSASRPASNHPVAKKR